MKKFGFFVLILVAISVFYVGNLHSNKLQAANEELARQDIAKKKEEEKALQAIKTKEIKKIEKNKTVLFSEYVKYISLKQDAVKTAFIGSSVAAGAGASTYEKSWASLLISDMGNYDKPDFIEVFSSNFATPGYKMADLLKDGKHKDLVEFKPDIVFVESCLINSMSQAEKIETAMSNTQVMINYINKKLPKTKIVLVESNPVKTSWLTTKEKENKYTDYLNSFDKLASANNLPIFKTYDAINKAANSKKLSIDKLLSDDIHPNDTGYSIWHEEMKKYLAGLKITI